MRSIIFILAVMNDLFLYQNTHSQSVNNNNFYFSKYPSQAFIKAVAPKSDISLNNTDIIVI